ncbi:alpha-protein kinase 2 [Spea bombifrons]|uniref:alpha-protein kinase 2 n=1 Tax=Spea bombifrons TaxID=233779 RepID=UPI0023496422|nr:alpha-protein kinase 2 [Spea bombifrons]
MSFSFVLALKRFLGLMEGLSDVPKHESMNSEHIKASDGLTQLDAQELSVPRSRHNSLIENIAEPKEQHEHPSKLTQEESIETEHSKIVPNPTEPQEADDFTCGRTSSLNDNGDFKLAQENKGIFTCHTGPMDQVYCLWHGSKYCCCCNEPNWDNNLFSEEELFDDCLNYLECSDVGMDYASGIWQQAFLGDDRVFLLEIDQDNETKASQDCLNGCYDSHSGVACMDEVSNDIQAMDAFAGLCVSHSDAPEQAVKRDFPGDSVQALRPEMVIIAGHQQDDISSVKSKERCKLPLAAVVIQNDQAGIEEENKENKTSGNVSTSTKSGKINSFLGLFPANGLDKTSFIPMTDEPMEISVIHGCSQQIKEAAHGFPHDSSDRPIGNGDAEGSLQEFGPSSQCLSGESENYLVINKGAKEAEEMKTCLAKMFKSKSDNPDDAQTQETNMCSNCIHDLDCCHHHKEPIERNKSSGFCKEHENPQNGCLSFGIPHDTALTGNTCFQCTATGSETHTDNGSVGSQDKASKNVQNTQKRENAKLVIAEKFNVTSNFNDLCGQIIETNTSKDSKELPMHRHVLSDKDAYLEANEQTKYLELGKRSSIGDHVIRTINRSTPKHNGEQTKGTSLKCHPKDETSSKNVCLATQPNDMVQSSNCVQRDILEPKTLNVDVLAAPTNSEEIDNALLISTKASIPDVRKGDLSKNQQFPTDVRSKKETKKSSGTENKATKKKFKAHAKEVIKNLKSVEKEVTALADEVFPEEEPKSDLKANNAEAVASKDNKKGPLLIQDIQAELFPDNSVNLKLYCHFGNIHADSTVTWTKESKLLARLHRSPKDYSPVSLAIVQTSVKDQGMYHCTLKNMYGKVTTDFHLTPEVLDQLSRCQDIDGGEEIEFNQLLFREDFITDMYFGGNLHGRIATDDLHFGEGVHRKAFRSKVMCGLLPVFNPGHLCVLKVHNAIAYGTKTNDELVQKNYKLAVQECYVQNTAREYAKIYAEEAGQLEAFGKVPEIIPIFLIHRPANNIPYATVEEELIGDFVKYSIRDGKEINFLRRDSEAGQKCCTFQHWVYERTNGNLLVTDMQGVGMKLTDVGIATLAKGYKGFKGNCSGSFIDQFKALHQCNKYCEILGLTLLRPSSKPKKPAPVKEKSQPNPPSSRKTKHGTKAKSKT